jgi:protein transport protein SEC13
LCEQVVWRVSWSLTGNILAVSSADNKVTLWKESLQPEPTWTCLSTLDEASE